jgi:hypothetical protein
MGANAKHKIELECSTEVIARETIEVYRRAVGRTAKAPKYIQSEPFLAATVEQHKASPGAEQ